MSGKYACRDKQLMANSSFRIETTDIKICHPCATQLKHCRVLQLFHENLMQLLFSYFPAPQTITSNLPQSMSPWPIESKSYRTSVFSQSDNISFGVSLASSPSLSLRTRAKANTDVSRQRALLSSRDSKQFFKTQNNFSLMSKSVNTYICELGRPCGGKL